MQRRRFEKVAVVLLSIIMLMTSTGIVSSLAVNVSESSAASVSSTAPSTTASEVAQEGGSLTTSTVVQEGGAVIDEDGDGTKANPFRISTAEQFLAIGSRVNNTSSADKYFVLANDIDLSGVTAKDIKNGSLIGIDKTLAAKSANVFIVLDGNGYSLKGLSLEITKGSEASVFGTLNEKSVISNLRIDRPVIRSTSSEMTRLALVATENKGTVSGITITYPVITAERADYAAFAAAVNYGTISDISVKGTHTNISTATADSHTISAIGTVGAVAGLNHGTITKASAINVGMFIPETEKSVVYGGIAGANSGSVLLSVSTGNAMGGKSADTVGGIVGKAVAPVGAAEAASTLTNNYTLTALSKTASGCGVIGADGKAEMIKDCFWSSDVSGKDVMATDFGAGVNDLAAEFIIIPEGKTATISAATIKKTVFGKANVELDGEITVKGESVSAQTEDGKAVITAEAAGKVCYAAYYAKITLPANVGATGAAASFRQYRRVTIITAAKDAEGDGTAAKPFVIKTATDFNMYKFAPSMNAVLGADIRVASTVPAIKGTFDGKAHTISASKPLAQNIYGSFGKVNIVITKDLDSAVLGNAIGADISGVAVSSNEGVKLNAMTDNRGLLFNRIGGQSKLDDCHAKGTILIGADKLSAIGGLAGLVDGKSAVTNSGAVVDITCAEGFTSAKTADLVGSVTADDAEFTSCYVDGNGGFIADMPEKIKLGKNIEGWSFDGSDAGFFTGNSGKFTITLPSIKAFAASEADYEVACDEKKLSASVSVADGKLILSVERAEGVVTVKSVPVTVTNKKTGLSATINVSNGLEKDADGRYIISTAFDLAYMSENIAELSTGSFIMTADVDMSAISGFAPIGSTDVAFSGTFDGNGKTISNLAIVGTAKVGLFAVIDGATVRNIRFVNADISAQGGYAAVLAGQVTGKSVISSITVSGARVQSHDLYAGVLVGAVDGAQSSITDITLNNNSVNSDSNYVGAVAGRVSSAATISGVASDRFTAQGASYVGGAVGLAIGEVAISDITVSGAKLSGVSEVSGIAGANGNVTIRDCAVRNSDISTLASTSANTAGGIAAVSGYVIENVTVENTAVSAGIAGGIVAKTVADGALSIKNASVKASKINSQGANTVAAGILGVHNVRGEAAIEASSIDEATVISGAALSAGLVGDCSGAESKLSVASSKTLATVSGCTDANAVSAAGALGRIGTSAVNNVTLSSLKVGGSISGAAAVGGIVGVIKSDEEYTGHKAIASDSVVFAQIDASAASSAGIIFGAVDEKFTESDLILLSVRDVVLSTAGGVSAYPTDKLSNGYKDLNGAVTPSVDKLTTKDETEITVFGLPELEGYEFDTESGWISESADRIQVVSATENKLILKAERRAQVNMIAYYVMSSDSQVRLPVSFEVTSDVYKALEGNGTQSEPYLVKDAYDLESVSQYADMGAYFALTQDIVLTDADYDLGGAFYNVGNGVVSVGSADKAFNGVFTGLYNGKTHSISGLRMSGSDFGGLFAVTDGAVISDLVINGADISASVGAGIIVGRARNTTIKNISINGSAVQTTGIGSAVGGVVGVGEQTTVDGASLNNVSVSTTLDSTRATVETAGGVAGIFDGVIRAVKLSAVKVLSDAIGGGIVGVANAGTYISDAQADATVTAETAAGAVGELRDAMYFGIDGATLSGKVSGTEASAGVIAEVYGEDEAKSFDKLNRSLIRDVVISTTVEGDATKAVVIANVSDKLAADKPNDQVNVFDQVYYSSYQNALGTFGDEQFNAYQNGEYEITDLSDIAYRVDGAVYPSIKLSTEFVTLSDDSIILSGAQGSYKQFTIGNRVYELEAITSDVKGLVEYDAAASAVRLTKLPAGEAKLVFVYNDSMKVAIDILAMNDVQDENAVNVSVSVVNATADAELSEKLIAVLLKSMGDKGADSLSFFATADSQPSALSALSIAEGRLFVDMLLPVGYTFTVNAVDENGESLLTEDADNEGILVNAGSAAAVSLTVTIEESESIWGLRSIWSVIGK